MMWNVGSIGNFSLSWQVSGPVCGYGGPGGGGGGCGCGGGGALQPTEPATFAPDTIPLAGDGQPSDKIGPLMQQDMPGPRLRKVQAWHAAVLSQRAWQATGLVLVGNS